MLLENLILIKGLWKYFDCMMDVKYVTAAAFLCKQEKCDFWKKEVRYLGHVISCKKVEMNPEKIASIHQWPIPKSTKALRRFLGLKGYEFERIYKMGASNKVDDTLPRRFEDVTEEEELCLFKIILARFSINYQGGGWRSNFAKD